MVKFRIGELIYEVSGSQAEEFTCATTTFLRFILARRILDTMGNVYKGAGCRLPENTTLVDLEYLENTGG